MKTALTIAGSDSGGGAGIQADLKTMLAQGVYGMSAITALTAQNTMGVRAISQVAPEFLAAQIDSVFEDIPPGAVKVGMVFSAELAGVIAERMSYYKVKNLVVDPVMVATSGARLLDETAKETLESKLLPLAKIITPNIYEAEVMSGKKIRDVTDMEQVARELSERFGCAVLCKGGHLTESADDVLCENRNIRRFPAARIDNPNTHGTGCTLSSAITAGLALGEDLPTAVQRGKNYVSGALSAGLNLGKGAGPLDHGFLFFS